ncbi:HAD-IB family hydrolase, partial [Myxococcota bacterium]|nr:HAD-IB family hydrolase [Myxococcota bacterium]
YAGLLWLSPMLTAYIFKLIPNHVAKEKLISHFFRGWERTRFYELADAYALKEIDKIVRPGALKKIRWHQEQGHEVVVVSASVECWLKRWCEKEKVELIGTRLEVIEGKLSGKFATKNCHGPEKVVRIKSRYELSDYETIYAYGDSSGDKEMLVLAGESYYRHFA